MKDEVARVPGGSNGIGAATARMLAQRGAAVVVADLEAGPMNKPPTSGVEYVRRDVAREEDWRVVACDKHGRQGIPVNCAGIGGSVAAGGGSHLLP